MTPSGRILLRFPRRTEARWSLRILDPERGEVMSEGPLGREAVLRRLLGSARSR